MLQQDCLETVINKSTLPQMKVQVIKGNFAGLAHFCRAVWADVNISMILRIKNIE